MLFLSQRSAEDISLVDRVGASRQHRSLWRLKLHLLKSNQLQLRTLSRPFLLHRYLRHKLNFSFLLLIFPDITRPTATSFPFLPSKPLIGRDSPDHQQFQYGNPPFCPCLTLKKFKLFYPYPQHIMTQLSVQLRHAKRSNKKDLNLSKRELSFIPKDVFGIRSLEELYLNDNKIASIEPAIAELFRLKVLNLENNALNDLPEEIMQLPKLTTLALRGNPLGKRFQALLNVKFADNLQDVLSLCFQGQNGSKSSSGKGKAETPSWLMEEKKPQSQESTIAWDSNIFRPQTGTKTGFGRRANKVEAVEVQAEREAVNGVLALRMSDLQIGEEISMGGFSTIHRGRCLQVEVAIKKVFNPNISEELLGEFNNQVNMLAKYRHPNIVLMLGAITTPPQLCLVMELVKEGSLFDLLHKRKAVLGEADRRRIALQIIGVVSYLHRLGVVHRDIKSHNILLDRSYTVKLCDFGLARHKSQLNSGPMQFSGTPTYMAQQLFQKRAYTETVDVFAVGTLLYELYAGQVPYHGLDPADIRDRVIKDASLPSRPAVKKSITEIINRCRAYPPQDRPSCSDLLKFNDW